MNTTVDEAVAVYRAYIDAENRRDRPGMEACLHPKMQVAINGRPQLADRDADAEATDRLLATYPDYLRTIGAIGGHHTARGVTVVAEWTMAGRGTVTVPSLEVHGCTIALVARGSTGDGHPVIVEARLYTDPAALAHVL